MSEGTARELSRGTRLTTCPLAKSAFGSTIRPDFCPRLEKTQNLVSMNVPEVIESLRASCNGSGTDMANVAMFAIPELFEALDGFRGYLHVVRARLVIFGVCNICIHGVLATLEYTGKSVERGE